MTIPQAAQAAKDLAPWIVVLARVGYTAKAVLYGTIGVLAAQAALGKGGRTTDVGGALREVVQAPMGEILLLVAAAGLAGYALWRVVDAITDAEARGNDAKGIVRRVASAVRGLAHAGLALAAFHIATGSNDDGGQSSERMTSRAFEMPGGELLVWVGAAVMFGYGAYQLYRAYAAKLGRQLNLLALPAGSHGLVIATCRAGIAARGIVFGLIGVLLARAARQHDAAEAGGIRESLQMLAGMGRWPLGLIALGLVAYALYELVNARYRRIRVT